MRQFPLRCRKQRGFDHSVPEPCKKQIGRNVRRISPLLCAPQSGEKMLGFMILFVLLAIIADYSGFIALAGLAAIISKLLFLLVIITVIIRGVGVMPRGRPPI